MATGSQNMTTYNARVVTGSNSAASPAGALLLSGAGRADDATGDTWLFLDSRGGTSTPWGIKHDQANNQIQIFGGGTNSVWTQMNTGNTYIGGNLNTGSTLTVRAQNNTREGGEIILSPATSSFSTAHIDTYDSLFRLHDGTNERFKVNISNGNTTINGNLGIGTDYAVSGGSYKLYVNGTSNLNGATSINGTLTTAGAITAAYSGAHLYLKNTQWTKGTTPSSQSWSAVEYLSNDSSNNRVALLETTLDTSGNSQFNIFLVPNVANSTSWSGIILKKTSDNVLTVSIAGSTSVTGSVSASTNIIAGTYVYAGTYLQAKTHVYSDTGHFYMKYNNTWYDVLHNHENGNISVNAAGTGLYVGYYNTTLVNWMNGRMQLKDGCLSIFPNNGSYREGIRIHATGSWSDITLCGNDNTGDSGTSANSWLIGNNNGNFYISRNGSSSGTSWFGSVGNVWKLYGNQTNSKSKQQSILHIYGPTYGNTAADMISGTAGLFSWGDGGPQITFDTSATPGGGQAGALIFTDNDTAATGASWHFVSNQGDWNVTSKRFHARTAISIGSDLPNTSYNLYVNGTSHFTGNMSFAAIGTTGTSPSISWSGSTDGASIYYTAASSDAGVLVINMTDDANARISLRTQGTERIGIDSNGTYVNTQLQRAGKSVSWYQGRAAAIMKTTSYSGYDAILSMKTTAGDWSLGVYTDNVCYLTYILDSNYNAGTNTITKQFYFKPDGTIGGNSFTGNASTATKLSNTPNNTNTFLRGDNTWTSTINNTIICIPLTSNMAASNMAFNGGIQVRESGGVGNDQSAIEYGPRISFHWSNRIAKSITLHSNGTFYFRDQNGITRSTIDANVVGALTGNASTATAATKVSLAASNTAFTDTATVALNGISIRWYSTASSFSGQPSQYGFLVTMATGDSVNENHQIFATQANGNLYHRGTNSSSHASPPAFKTILDSSNYTSYTVTKTGSGASGSWGISVTGSSASCTGNAATATNVAWTGVTGKPLYTRSSVGTLDWATYKDYVIMNSALAYWNGCYSGTASNLQYCDRGRFGTIITKATTDYRANTAPASGAWYTGTPAISSSGVMEIGRYIDFHSSNASTADYGYRLDNSADGQLVGSGTLALVNNTQNNATYNALLYISHTSNNDWGAIITKGSSYDYGLQVICKSDGSYGVSVTGRITGTKVYGAVWNDYAECRSVESNIEAGRVVYETNQKVMQLAPSRLQPGCKVVSDTYGMCIGETEEAKTPIAVTGRVLVYPYRIRTEYELGAAVCSAPGGTVDIMTRDEIIMYPERIIGTVSEIPDYDIWHAGERDGNHEIEVKGRIWIYVK